MPRQLRIEYEGAIYHVMNRGDHGEPIFSDDHDRKTFLKTLGETCTKAYWQIHAYCLMNNHFHLVIETPQPTLVAGMKWLLGVYTQRFNARHQKRGHLFAGRYKSLIVDGSKDHYFRAVCDYVHLNPARAQLLKPNTNLETYPWSSFYHYLQPSSKRVSWLRVDRLFGEHGIQNDNHTGRKEFCRIMNLRCASDFELDEIAHKVIQRGWKFGTQQFMEELQEKINFTPDKKIHTALECNETMEVLGKRLIQEKLKKLKITSDSLNFLPKTAPLKIELAEMLRSKTTLPWEWIARELQAGTRGTLANVFYKKKKL